ncbi:MAG: alpha/beta hydrolase [Mesorhizobium sp.]|nr:MAG: alpha/beta hydrolase [Mesorhizobium sp.]
MADDTIATIRALDLRPVDLIGFSRGGFIAQQILFDTPDLIRRAIRVCPAPITTATLPFRRSIPVFLLLDVISRPWRPGLRHPAAHRLSSIGWPVPPPCRVRWTGSPARRTCLPEVRPASANPMFRSNGRCASSGAGGP